MTQRKKRSGLHVRGVRRKQIDEDKIALAYLLLAKEILKEQDAEASTVRGQADDQYRPAEDA